MSSGQATRLLCNLNVLYPRYLSHMPESDLHFQAVELKVSDVVVLIDREQGGASRLAADGLRLHAAFTLSFILEVSAAHIP